MKSLHYAHCVKFTPGQLDRYPFSDYEMREVPCEVYVVCTEGIGTEFQIRVDGKPLATERELKDAVSLAKYELMSASRSAMELNTITTP